MVKPQQPELARSGRGEVDPHAVKTRHGGPTDTTDAPAPVPEANLPGHHPEHEQDKPDVTPRARPRGRRGAVATQQPEAPVVEAPRRATFAFAFDTALALAALPFGVTPFTTRLDIADGRLHVRFGPWSVSTPLDNVEGAEATGPYAWFKVAGPAHISLKDRGLTFATNARRGVCIRFKQPVTGIAPTGMVRHPALTVTVDRPDDLVAALTA